MENYDKPSYSPDPQLQGTETAQSYDPLEPGSSGLAEERKSEVIERNTAQDGLSPEEYGLNKLRMTRAQFDRYKFAFELLDLSDSGKISKLDFEQMVGYFGLANHLSQDDFNDMFTRLDLDGDKHFTLSDFLREINDRHLFKILARIARTTVAKENEINRYRIESGKQDRSLKLVDYKEEEHADIIAYAMEVLKMEKEHLMKLIKAFKSIDLSQRAHLNKTDFDLVLQKFSLLKDFTIEEFEELFKEMDKDNDGKIGLQDFLETIHAENASLKFKQVFNAIFKKIDHTLHLEIKEEHDKEAQKEDIDEETLLYAMDTLGMDEGYIRKIFKVLKAIDLDGNLPLSKAQVDSVIGKFSLHKLINLEQFEDLFREMDKDGDGLISLLDLLKTVNDQGSSGRFRRIFNAVVKKHDDSIKLEEKEDPFTYKDLGIHPDTFDFAKEELGLKDDYLKQLVNVFKKIAPTQDSLLTKTDFDLVLKKFSLLKDITIEEFEELFREMDKDNDGKIGVQDFLATIRSENASTKFKQVCNAIFKKVDPTVYLYIKKETEEEAQKEYIDENTLMYAKEMLGMEEGYIRKLAKVFKAIDQDGNLSLSKADFDIVLNKFSLHQNISLEEFENLFREMDKDGDGQIGLLDFLKSVNDTESSGRFRRVFNAVFKKHDNSLKLDSKEDPLTYQELGIGFETFEFAKGTLGLEDDYLKKLVAVFKAIDPTHDALLTKADLDQILAKFSLEKMLTLDQFEELFKEMDKDGDGRISLSDFLETVNDESSSGRFRRLFNLIFKKHDKSVKLESKEDQLTYKDIGISSDTFAYAKENLGMSDDYLNRLAKIFKALSISGSPVLTIADLDLALKKFSLEKHLTFEEFEGLFRELDKDGNGEISQLDFLKSMSDENSSDILKHVFNSIFKKEDKTLYSGPREKTSVKATITHAAEVVKDKLGSVLGANKTEAEHENKKPEEPKADAGNFKLQIEQFMWWLDCNDSMQIDVKVNLARIVKLLLQEQFEDHNNLSRDDKMTYFASFMEIMGNELKEHVFMTKRIGELEKALEEERSHRPDLKSGKVKRLILRPHRKSIEGIEKAMNPPHGASGHLEEQVESTRGLYAELEGELEKLKTQLDHSEALKEAGHEVHNKLQDQVELLNSQLERTIAENKQIVEENKRFSLKVRELEQERTQLYRDLSEVKKDLEIVYKDEDERRRQIEELCSQVKESVNIDLYKAVTKERDALANESANLKTELIAAKRSSSLSREERKKLEAQISELEAERAQLREACKNVNGELKTIIQEVEEFEVREKEHLRQIDLLNIKNAGAKDYEEELKALKTENDSLKAQVRTYELRKSQRGKENAQPNKEKGKAPGQGKQALQFELDEMKKELEGFKKKEQKYEEFFKTQPSENLRMEYNVLVERVEFLENENDQLRSRLAPKSSDVDYEGSTEQKNLIEEIDKVERNLKNLQQKENAYDRDVQELSRELRHFTNDTGDMRLNNNVMQSQMKNLSEEVRYISQANSNLQEVNKRLHQDINSLQKALHDLKSENDQYAYQLESMGSSEASLLKQEYEKLRLENQNLKVKNMILEDRVEILDKENHQFRQQAYETNRRQSHRSDVNLSPYQHVTPTKVESYSRQTGQSTGKVGTQESSYLTAIEKLKEELKHVRESREAILHTLEKERGTIRDVIEHMPKSDSKYRYSEKWTPIKTGSTSYVKGSILERLSAQRAAEPTARKVNFGEYIHQSAPQTVKKVVTRQYQSLSSKKPDTSSQELGGSRETVFDTSKFAFQILYWLTDNAIITKELCNLYSASKLDELEIKQILREAQVYGERARAYYSNQIASNAENEAKAVFEFVLPLFGKCYKSQGQLKEIQTRVINHLKQILPSGETTS